MFSNNLIYLQTEQSVLSQVMSNKKNKVIEVATMLFAKNGFESTSMANICLEANVSKGLVYHHFKSKESILVEIFTQTTNQMAAMGGKTLSSSKPEVQIQQLIKTIFSQLKQDKHLFQFNLNVMFQPTTRKILLEQIERRANILLKSVKDIFDHISPERSTVLSYMFIAEIDGIALSYLSIFDDYPLEMIKEELLEKYRNLK